MYKNILLPLDINDPAHQKKACETATALAKTFDAKLHILCVVPDFGMSIVGSFFPKGYEAKMLAEAEAQLDAFVAETFPEELVAQRIVGHGSIYQVILDTAKSSGAELIIMHSHRPELEDYLIGPNAARVTRHARVSVMVVRD
ncbi:MAG: universal stress protein [Pseudomonadota bacterium]